MFENNTQVKPIQLLWVPLVIDILVQGKNDNYEAIVFYTAEVVLILEYLRKEGIVHR